MVGEEAGEKGGLCISPGTLWLGAKGGGGLGTERSVVSLQPLSMCLLIMFWGTLASQMGHSTSATGSDILSTRFGVDVKRARRTAFEDDQI